MSNLSNDLHNALRAEFKRINKAELNKEFRFKEEQSYDAKDIVVDGIENTSGPAIAKQIVNVLARKGIFVQWLPNKSKSYLYEASRPMDMRGIAMAGVQMSRILPHMNEPKVMEDVIASTYVWKDTFRDIAHANQSKGLFTIEDKKANWVEHITKVFNLCVDAGLIETAEDDEGNTWCIHTQKYLGSCISRKCVKHSHELVTLDSRRKERVKGQYKPRKDNTSAARRNALSFIESNGQVNNPYLLETLTQVVVKYAEAEAELPPIIANNLHVINGAASHPVGKVLYSEYFLCVRGRFYQHAHAGSNPQASDMAKALTWISMPDIIQKDSVEYDRFMVELTDEVVPDETWLEPAKLRYAGENMLNVLLTVLANNPDGDGLPFKKFFTYLEMARLWCDFEDKGEADVRLGFGPDGKCSGAQILSILAGCPKMAEACGLTTSSTRAADPYANSGTETALVMKNSVKFKHLRLLTRNEIKTPFMAVQYGGGVPSLIGSAKFIKTMNEIGVAEHDRFDYCEAVVEGITNALGPIINSFIKNTQVAVRKALAGRTSFNYRHIDGFKCTKKGDADVMLTKEPFRITLPEKNKSVIFGSIKNDTGWSLPSIEEGDLQENNFVYFFIVHWVQGLDAVMASMMANKCQEAGIEGYTSIHDQFRSKLSDCAKLDAIIADVYREMFIKNDPVAHLEEQLGRNINPINPLNPRQQVVTEAILQSPNAFFFE